MQFSKLCMAALCLPFLLAGCSKVGSGSLFEGGWTDGDKGQIVRTTNISGGTANLTAVCEEDGLSDVKVSVAFRSANKMPIDVDPAYIDGGIFIKGGFQLDSTSGNGTFAYSPDGPFFIINSERGELLHPFAVAHVDRAQLTPNTSLKIQVHLAGGQTAIVDVKPADPKFQALLKSCFGGDEPTVAPSDKNMKPSSGTGSSSSSAPSAPLAPEKQSQPDAVGDSQAAAASSSSESTPEVASAVVGHWVTFPTAAQFNANYPAKALDDEVAGTATVRCEAMNEQGAPRCVVVSEHPAGYGFGNATIQTLRAFGKIGVDDGQPLVGATVTNSSRWSLSK